MTGTMGPTTSTTVKAATAHWMIVPRSTRGVRAAARAARLMAPRRSDAEELLPPGLELRPLRHHVVVVLDAHHLVLAADLLHDAIVRGTRHLARLHVRAVRREATLAEAHLAVMREDVVEHELGGVHVGH